LESVRPVGNEINKDQRHWNRLIWTDNEVYEENEIS